MALLVQFFKGVKALVTKNPTKKNNFFAASNNKQKVKQAYHLNEKLQHQQLLITTVKNQRILIMNFLYRAVILSIRPK